MIIQKIVDKTHVILSDHGHHTLASGPQTAKDPQQARLPCTTAQLSGGLFKCWDATFQILGCYSGKYWEAASPWSHYQQVLASRHLKAGDS